MQLKIKSLTHHARSTHKKKDKDCDNLVQAQQPMEIHIPELPCVSEEDNSD